MATHRHAHSDLIDKVGSALVVERFSLSHQMLHNWRVRGIPHLKRIAFARLAADRGVVPPADFLEKLAA